MHPIEKQEILFGVIKVKKFTHVDEENLIRGK